jgi:hypothetical protein
MLRVRGRWAMSRRGNTAVASPELMRRRGLRVLSVWRYVIVYTPRGHWSENL